MIPKRRSDSGYRSQLASERSRARTLERKEKALAANGGHWKGIDDLEIATCAWVSWFNDERLHGELDDRTPLEVETEYRDRSRTNAA